MTLQHKGRGQGGLVDSEDLRQEYREKELSRRAILQGALAAAAVAACGSDPAPNNTVADSGTTVDSGTPDAGQSAVDSGTTVDVPPARTPHLVGLGWHESDHVEAARRALEETLGLGMISRGQTVYLKVNTNSGDAYPYSTSPELIRWVVGLLRDLGAEVFIGDRSFWGDRNTQRNFDRNGISDIASELNVPLHVFGSTENLAAGPRADSTGVEWMDLPAELDQLGARNQWWDGTMRIPVMVAQADHIINMPCMKTHFIATFTMSMKNIIGIVNPVDRSRTPNLGSHDGRANGKLFRQTAFMNKALPTVSLNILDGWNALITGGPTPTDRPPSAPSNFEPQIGEPHVVVCSVDRVATDLTGAAVLRTLSPSYELITRGTSLWDNRQIAPAVAAGIGITARDQYDLSGPTWDQTGAIRTIATT